MNWIHCKKKLSVLVTLIEQRATNVLVLGMKAVSERVAIPREQDIKQKNLCHYQSYRTVHKTTLIFDMTCRFWWSPRLHYQ